MGVGGRPVISQLFTSPSPSSSSSSSSSQVASTPSQKEGEYRTGYGREGRLRLSSSLQDFSTHWKGTASAGVPRSPSSIGAFGSDLPSQHVPRNDVGGGATLTTIKSNLVRRSSGTVISPFGRNIVCTRGRVAVALITLFGILFLLNILWVRNGSVQDHLEYAIVIDCGSTGTRVHVYGWAHKFISGKESLPVIVYPPPAGQTRVQTNGAPTFDKGPKQSEGRAYTRMETLPGLDKRLHNESGVASAVGPLIQWAAKQVPRAVQRDTKLFFLATAGLRRLPPVDSGWLLDRVWMSLVQSPFLCRRDWVRIITGKEEAYYGWIALNYNLGRLGRTAKQPTLGTLDLGGSSLEVAFEPRERPKEYSVNVSIGSAKHHLYANSHPGFGLNDAFEKSVALLIESGIPSGKGTTEGPLRVVHPCLNSGYKQPYICSSHCVIPSLVSTSEPQKRRVSTLSPQELGPKVELIGNPNWTLCQRLAQSVINVSGVSKSLGAKDCEQSPCALGKHQPQPEGHFFALSGFFVVFKFFGLTSANTLDDLLLRGQEFCRLKWEEAQQSVVSQPNIDRYCFRAPYAVGLLRQGLHLTDEQVLIGSPDFAWTLGAALHEAGALLPSNPRTGQGENAILWLKPSTFPLDVHSFTFLFVFILLVLLLLACSWRWIPSRSLQRPYLPLFVPPTSNGLFSRLPLTLGSQVPSASSSGATAGQPDEGWAKQPHSPAPFPRNSFQHQVFGSGIRHAGGDGPVLECDVLQLPSSAYTSGSGSRSQLQLATLTMKQKGGSRLLSRRTLSREDLSHYIPVDKPHSAKGFEGTRVDRTRSDQGIFRSAVSDSELESN